MIREISPSLSVDLGVARLRVLKRVRYNTTLLLGDIRTDEVSRNVSDSLTGGKANFFSIRVFNDY